MDPMSKPTPVGEQQSTPESAHALVIGAQSGIARALCDIWCADESLQVVHAVSRSPEATVKVPAVAGDSRLRKYQCDHSESAIDEVVASLSQSAAPLRQVAIFLGALQSDDFQPEKTQGALSPRAMEQVYHINCVLPLIWLARLMPLFRRQSACRVAVLSARVGSIGDNSVGGWWSYRCSKAALNMGLKCSAIELARRAPGVKLVAYHPGTVDTSLSKPFQRGVPEGKLFTPEFAAGRLDAVLKEQPLDGELSYLDWQGKSIPW